MLAPDVLLILLIQNLYHVQILQKMDLLIAKSFTQRAHFSTPNSLRLS